VMAEAKFWQKVKHKHPGANPKCPCKRCTEGWYSRRHPTKDAQDAARVAWQESRGPDARRNRAIVRKAAKDAVHKHGEALDKLAQ
jgi:hypothetical protein